MKIPKSSNLITDETIQYIKSRMAGENDMSHADYNLLQELVTTVFTQSHLHSWSKSIPK